MEGYVVFDVSSSKSDLEPQSTTGQFDWCEFKRGLNVSFPLAGTCGGDAKFEVCSLRTFKRYHAAISLGHAFAQQRISLKCLIATAMISRGVMDTTQAVRTGVWIDLSKSNNVLGATLTVPSTYGYQLVSVLALLIQVAGTYSWFIWRFVIHQFGRHELPRRAVIRQQEVVIRNSESALAIINPLWNIDRAWAKAGLLPRERRRTFYFSVSLFTIIHTLLYQALAIVGTSTLVQSNIVLQKPLNCGIWNFSRPKDITDPKSNIPTLQQWSLLSLRTTLAESYARVCYSDSMGRGLQKNFKTADCSHVYKTKLEVNITNNVPCPLRDKKLCAYGANGAVLVDTGYQSPQQLGVNLRSTARFRQTATCAPIFTEKFRYNDTAATQVLGVGSGGLVYSFAERLLSGNKTIVVRDESLSSYAVITELATDPTFKFSPLLDLDGEESAGGQLTLIHIVTNGVAALLQRNDTSTFSFSNPTKVPFPFFPLGTIPAYLPSPQHRLTTIACFERVQLCRNSECAWGGFFDQRSKWFKKIYDESTGHDRGLFENVMDQQVLTSMGQIAGASSLVAQDTLLPLESGANFPDGAAGFQHLQTADMKEHWKLEVSNWFNIALASLQLTILFFPNQPWSTAMFGQVIPPFSSLQRETQYLCSAVKIRSNSHTSLNLLGLILILVLTLLFVTLGTQIDKTSSLFGRRRRGVRALAWTLDAPLYLLKLVHEKMGIGEWRTGERYDVVPVCEPDLVMAVPVVDAEGQETVVERFKQETTPLKKFSTTSEYHRRSQDSEVLKG